MNLLPSVTKPPSLSHALIFLMLTIMALMNASTVDAFMTTFPNHKYTGITLRPMLASSINEGEMALTRGDDNESKLSYRIARPMSLSSRQAAPIVTLHHGKTSEYLYLLETHVPYRSIVYYSYPGTAPKSIEQAVDDIEALLKKLGLNRFHLYGHSRGGIVAFEYMKRLAESNGGDDDVECLSAILSSTPTSVKLAEEEANQLVSNLSNGSSDDVLERFRIEHCCRTEELPQELVNLNTCVSAAPRQGLNDAFSAYEARPPSEEASRMPSCMVVRGEHDFITEKCIEEWKDLFNHKCVRSKVVDGCSHHALHENGSMCYGDLIDSYYAEYD